MAGIDIPGGATYNAAPYGPEQDLADSVPGMSASAEWTLEEHIAEWRTFVRRRRVLQGPDVDELELHLREQLRELRDAGLADDEAFLVAVKRMGSLDALSREFARVHSERLWKQLVVAPAADDDAARSARTETFVVLALAGPVAVASTVPELSVLRLVHGSVVLQLHPHNANP